MPTKRRPNRNHDKHARDGRRDRRDRPRGVGVGVGPRGHAGPDDWQIAALADAPVGPDVVVPSLEAVLAAIGRLPSPLDWSAVRHDVVPVLPRLRPAMPGTPDPVELLVAPGIAVRFGVDAGPMFLGIHAGMLDGWGLGQADLLATALDNLRRRASAVRPDAVVTERVGGTPVRALQSGTSTGSALVLLPDELVRLFGAAPQLLVAPMRDLLLALPVDVDRALAWDLYETFASQDPNCLPAMGFLLRDGDLVLEPPMPGALDGWPSVMPAASYRH
jgi:hypothetical protein